MDIVSLGFLVIMVLVGGVVALMGDNLGRTIGKKRLTFLHLRPRHTATLFTVGAGMLIPLVTVVFVATASEDVRRWLSEGRQAIQQRDLAVKSRDDALRQSKVAREEATKLRQEAIERRAENDRLRKDVEKNRTEIAGLERRSRELLNKVSDALSDLKKANAEIRTTELLRLKASEQLALAKSDLLRVQREFKVLDTSYGEIEKQFRELNERNHYLDQQNSEFERNSERLKAELATLEVEKRTSLQRLETTKLNLDEARTELERAGNALAAMQQMLSRNLDASRRNPLIFSMGEELARIPFGAGVDQVEARTQLDTLLRHSRDVAINRGARSPDGAGLFSRFTRTTTPPREMSVDEQVAMLVERLAGKPEDQLLVAISALNAFQGEFVALDMRIVPNPVVFRKGDLIAEVRIDGDKPESLIYRQLSSFIDATVAPKAYKSGLLPAPGRGRASIPVTEDELTNLAKSIHAQERTVRLVALAAAETRAAGPLELQFRVR